MKNFNKTITPVTTPGIYHNVSQGLISLSSDGTNWITIADKNLGATQVYNNGDTLSEANSGKYYQWGNNYGFTFTGAVTTSSTQVNAQNYGPGNYYSSSTFITRSSSPFNWDSSNNLNLRGDLTNTNDARKGPCDTGFHIPSYTDISNMKTVLNDMGITTGTNVSMYLKIPFAGQRLYNNSNNGQGSAIYLWSSSDGIGGLSGSFYRAVFYASSGAIFLDNYFAASGYNIRPFANTPVQPDDTWTVLYQPS